MASRKKPVTCDPGRLAVDKGRMRVPQKGWSSLPEVFFVNLLERLESVDIKAVRLTCKPWLNASHATLRTLKPRSKQVLPILAKFGGLDALDLSQMADHRCDETEIVEAERRLRSLKLKHSLDYGSLADLTILTNLTHLDFNYTGELQDAGRLAHGPSHWSHLSGLMHLDLCGSRSLHGLNLLGLQPLKKLKSLVISQVHSCGPAALCVLGCLTSLTRLSIHSCIVGDQWYYGDSYPGQPGSSADVISMQQDVLRKVLQTLTGLQKLRLWSCKLMTADYDSDSFSHLTGLKTLEVGDWTPAADERRVSSLACMTSLEHLRVGACGQTCGRGVSSLTTLTRLTSLDLHIDGLKNTHLLALTRLRGLKALGIDNLGGIACKTVKKLGSCLTQLEILHVDHAKFTVEGFETLFKRAPLRSIKVARSKVVDEAIGPLLRQLTAVTHLNLRESDFTTCDVLSGLAALPRLAILDLSLCKMQSVRLENLSGLTTMKHLSLAGISDDFGSAEALRNLTRLTHLALQDTNFNDDMSASLQPLRHMRILALSRTLVSDAGLASLAGMTALQCLAVEGCQHITREGVRQHLQPLAAQHSLSEVCFDYGDQEVTKAVETHLPGCRVQGHFNDAKYTPGHAAENW